ncbi:Peptidase family M28 [Myroides guanonis]|uniref:Peptidase family M28 n=2 Tax=Myroides guanonis TaxID=1150112 RepID=A0A1I3M9V0_9FLAO|nr:Peptidase family M28 [Myroides guanonis]
MYIKAGFFVFLLQNLDMKFYVGVVFFILLSCSSNSTVLNRTNEVDLNAIKETLFYLSSDELQGRKSGEAGNVLASEFLINKMEDYQVKPLFASFKDTLTNFPNTWNVVGLLPGTDKILKDEYIVLGAHYDHIGLKKQMNDNEDIIANGANDNASGVAILTEITRYLSKSELKRSVIIAYFTAEEDGLLGSEHLAEKLKSEGYNVGLMLNFEMLGVGMDRNYLAYLTGYDKSNLADIIHSKKINLIGYFEGESERSLFKRSDNYPFYLEFGTPSHTFSSFDFENYPYYHHVKDEYKEMDLKHIEAFTKDIAPVVQELINAPLGLIKNNK